jgi:citrate lyase subunit beta/citryl-CoA lyase
VKLHDEQDLPLWRSQIIVPVNVDKYVAKAATLATDAIILDLEDSITPPEKVAARALVADAVKRCAGAGADMLVRINQPLELAVRDVEAVISAGVMGLVLPKIDSASHVRLLAELVDMVEAARGLPRLHTKFMVLIETAGAFGRLAEIAAAHPRVVAISVGSEDFSLDTQSQPDPDVLLYPKQQMVIAACTAGILPIGVIGSIANYRDLDGYRAAIARSRRFGLRGASCIHPDIVPLLNAGFGPAPAEVAEAERVIAAFDSAKAAGRGSLSVDGKMIDIPVVLRAERVVKMAERIRQREQQRRGSGR